jgi:hypothetical protein
MRGSVCSGYVSIALQRGLKIRVGRKPGRDADMMRITPRSQADSPLLRAHDSALRKYKVVKNYPRVAARIWSRVIHALSRSEPDPLTVVCNEHGHPPGREQEIEETARMVALSNGMTWPPVQCPDPERQPAIDQILEETLIANIDKMFPLDQNERTGCVQVKPCPGAPRPVLIGGYVFWTDELNTPEQQAEIEADFNNSLRNVKEAQDYHDLNPIEGEIRPMSSDPLFDHLDLPF